MIFSTFRLDLPLKEFFIGALLDLNKIRNVDATVNARIVFPLDKLLQSRFGHSPVLHYKGQTWVPAHGRHPQILETGQIEAT
jgi:hypothetical protein